jgi:hypothetical protein
MHIGRQLNGERNSSALPSRRKTLEGPDQVSVSRISLIGDLFTL